MVRSISNSLQRRITNWFDRDCRETFLERIRLVFESEKLYADEPDAVKYGHTLYHILENITPLTGDGPIAGAVKLEIPTSEERQEILDHYSKWWNKPLQERQKKALFYYSEAWLRCRPDFFMSMGHLAMDWEAIIDKGLPYLRAAAEKRLAEPCDEEQKHFLNGALICYDAISMYMNRLADAAEQEGKTAVSENLRQVSSGPANTFEQALQLIWIIILIEQKVCGCGVLNLDRMDQYLLRRYRADIESGILTENRAVELLQEFYFLNNEIMVQTDHMSTETENTRSTLEVAFDDPNYLILGGKLPDGAPGVNELSFLMVEAARSMKLRNPFLVVRYYRGINPDFWRYCCDAMRENTTLVIYNDETMIPALKAYGVQSPEVFDYGFFGCNDPTIPAMTGGLRQVWMNLAKPLELALNQGNYPMVPIAEETVKHTDDLQPLDSKCQFRLDDRMTGLMTGPYYGVKTKPVSEMKSMEDVIDAYKEQVEYLIGEFRRGFEQDLRFERPYAYGRIRIEDCFIKGTIENACTWTEGGTKYHPIITQGCGLSTAIDSLYAIDEVCFQEKKMSLQELASILAADFKGHENLSDYLKRKVAKFGNGHDKVDRYAKIVTDIFTGAVQKYNGSEYLYQMWPTYSTDRDFTTMGKYVGATPDGRHAGEQISENQSPMNGCDKNGLTALLNSESKVPFNKITGGPLNLRIHPSAVKDEDGLTALCALFKTYFDKGGMQIQVNVVDAQTLREAQKHPEKYRTLCVRVTGYSAFFVEMGKKAQDELIARTEHLVA